MAFLATLQAAQDQARAAMTDPMTTKQRHRWRVVLFKLEEAAQLASSLPTPTEEQEG